MSDQASTAIHCGQLTPGPGVRHRPMMRGSHVMTEKYDPCHSAALIENLLRDAVKLARAAYGPMMQSESSRWLLLALADALDLPQELFYGATDQIENYLSTLDRLIGEMPDGRS